MYTTNQSIRSWAEDDRPREKLALKGSKHLTNAELLAILLNTGYRNKSALDLAKEILASCNNNLHLLARLTLNDLCKFKGVGEAKAISLLAVLELANRKISENEEQKIKITTANSAFHYLRKYFAFLPHEEFYVLYLNRKNEILSCKQLSKGGITGTVADSRLIFKFAIECSATSIILAHNHPSGQTLPSIQDEKLTEKMVQIGELMQISVLDHLIITDNAYFSFMDEGKL